MQGGYGGLARRGRNFHADHTRRDGTAAIRIPMVMVMMMVAMVVDRAALLIPDRRC